MKPRFGLKWKIFTGGIGLSLAIVATNLVYSTRVIHQAASRYHELEQSLRRYEVFQSHVSQGYAAAVEAWAASSTALRDALGRGDDEAARPIIRSVEQSLADNVHPDFLVVIDRHGDAIVSTNAPFTPESAQGMALFADAKAGRRLRDSLLVHQGRAYLVNGVPITREGAVVGALVIGVRLEQVLTEFRNQSHDDPRRQIDLALMGNTGAIVASSLPAEQWNDAATALARPVTAAEGAQAVPVVTLVDGAHFLFRAVRNGYDGNTIGVVGTLYALRNRTDPKARIDSLIADNVVVGILALLFGFLISLLLALTITRPLRRMIEATAEIAKGQGDLTKRLEVTSSDELGELAQNVNAVFDNLQRLAGEVQDASEQVGGSSAEISASSRQMLAGAKEQAVKIESSTAAVTELSSSIQQVASNAVEATKVARESGTQVQSAIDGMSRIRATVDGASAKIHALGESGKRIGNIVEVIRQISEQTSLLALNASIEAAHAGEQGRGFAVVADEVSSLARRVGQSAKDIEDLIGTIKEQTSAAVTSMEAGAREVDGGTKFVVQTLQSLRQIIEVIQDTASAVQEQAVVSDEIARNMDAVQRIAQEVLASSEAAVRHGENLRALAGGLEESVRGFRLAESGTPRPLPPPAVPLLAEGRTAGDRRRTPRG